MRYVRGMHVKVQTCRLTCAQEPFTLDRFLPLILRAQNSDQALYQLLHSLFIAVGQRVHRIPEADDLMTQASQVRF